jgi:acetate kinase
MAFVDWFGRSRNPAISSIMQQPKRVRDVLVINAGSSSIKFALFDASDPIVQIFEGAIERIGMPNAQFRVCEIESGGPIYQELCIPDRVTAVNMLVDWLLERIEPTTLAAIAHRIVYGGTAVQRIGLIDRHLLASLYDSMLNEPEHLPLELHLIEALRRKFVGVAHCACFDSWFHRTMPRVAYVLAIPRKYEAIGLRRYGFHGLSCEFLMRELERIAGRDMARGRVIIAHLGGGASVTALSSGQSCDTTMGLTPAGGIVMGSRSGDLDPGVGWHLARHEGMTAATFNHMVNHESGMLGISEVSGYIQELLACEKRNPHAAEALAIFCYQARKAICAMAGAIGGIDTLIFSGGIGEHCAEIRARICDPLAFLGLKLDNADNGDDASLISSAGSAVAVRVIHSDEQWMIAEETRLFLDTALYKDDGASVS